MIDLQIKRLFWAEAEELGTSLSVPIAYPKLDFSPPEDGVYIQVSFLPNLNRRPFLNGSDPHYRQGIFQLMVVSPIRSSLDAQMTLAGQIVNAFPADRKLFGDSVTVKITKEPDQAPMFESELSSVIPVSVSYEAFA